MGCSAGRGHQHDPKNDVKVFRVVLIGDPEVGKSGILSRYAENKFSNQYIYTIGVDFKNKYLNIGDSSYKLQIWDTAGQEIFRTIVTAYYRGAQGIILVYSVTNRESFEHIRLWAAEVKEYGTPDVKTILVGNKIDLHDQREVLYDEGRQLANELGIQGFFEISAKENENIDELFFEKLALMDGRAPFVNVKRARN